MNNTPLILIIANLHREQAMAAADALSEEYWDPPAVTVNETDEKAGLWNVIAYGNETAEAENLRKFLLGRGFSPAGMTIERLPQVDWVRETLAGLPPVIAGRFFVHGEHDRQRRRSGGCSLEIGATTAFGTGHHGTTAGCLNALDNILKSRAPRKILDVGCGTGILAIAAAASLHQSVTASDIDPEAVAVTRHYARLNNVGPLVETQTAAGLNSAHIRQNGPYELVFANILARPLLAMASALVAVLKQGGYLVLSGLTLDQERQILATYRNRGAVPVRKIHRDGWATLVLRK